MDEMRSYCRLMICADSNQSLKYTSVLLSKNIKKSLPKKEYTVQVEE